MATYHSHLVTLNHGPPNMNHEEYFDDYCTSTPDYALGTPSSDPKPQTPNPIPYTLNLEHPIQVTLATLSMRCARKLEEGAEAAEEAQEADDGIGGAQGGIGGEGEEGGARVVEGGGSKQGGGEGGGGGNGEGAKWQEKRNVYAVGVLRKVRQKIEGRDGGGVKMSVAEQVDQTIRDATNTDRLCVMYEGWTPWA